MKAKLTSLGKLLILLTMCGLIALIYTGCGSNDDDDDDDNDYGDADAPYEGYDLYGPPPATSFPPAWNPPNGAAFDDVFFKDYGTNAFIDTEDDHFSTFGMDVDTASYSVMRRYIHEGSLPPPEAVRVEEFINAFDYNYEPPFQLMHSQSILRVRPPDLVKANGLNCCESASKDGSFKVRTGRTRY